MNALKWGMSTFEQGGLRSEASFGAFLCICLGFAAAFISLDAVQSGVGVGLRFLGYAEFQIPHMDAEERKVQETIPL